MRKILLIIAVVLVVFSCTNKNKSDKNNAITVTILPQKYFVEQIAGTTFPINVMLPPGSSPDDYEPTPKQVQELNKSFVYFYIGHLGFEKSWMKKFSETATEVHYVSCSNGIDLLVSEHEHCTEAEGLQHQHGTDPHIWTSPENVKTISRNIFNTLTAKFPEKTDEFKANLDVFINKIDSLDFYIRATFDDTLNTDFMIFHPALGYYADDYHLSQHSIEYEGKSPSTAHMKRMVDLARERGIKTVFVQTQFETSKAEAIAKEINAEMVVVDPLAEDWLGEMYSLTAKMKKALSR
jgi:zinc transport system substrate-binding protein